MILDNPDDFFIKGKLYTFVNKYMYESDTGSFYKNISNDMSITQYIHYDVKVLQFLYLSSFRHTNNVYNCSFLNDKNTVYFIHCPTQHRLLKDFWVAI